jgi:YegS/Rv2252/BmrU family lipid kinase
MIKNPIPIIINPASGKPQPILHTISAVFRAHDLPWEAHITHQFGDATRFAREAVAQGAEMVVVYGGDGTVLEVANGVMGSDVPIGILPGGTGNAVATELGISRDITEAAELICRSPNRRAIDAVQVDDRYYLLRAYTGISQDQAASREMKDKYHLLAYPMAVLDILSHAPKATYRVTVDGETVTTEAMTVFVNNLANLGGIDIDLGSVQPDNGKVDVLIVSKNVGALREVGRYALHLGPAKTYHYHTDGRQVTLEADPPQPVWLDGEYYKETPVTLNVHPGAVTIIVP